MKKTVKKNYKKYGENCPECRRPLVWRTSRKDGRKFVGCMGYPSCTYTMSINFPKSKVDFAVEEIDNSWKANYDNNVERILLHVCQSQPERKCILGVLHFLDFNFAKDGEPNGCYLYYDTVKFNGITYEGIRVREPYEYWGGGSAPSAMIFVPQLLFANNKHHDFGVFTSGDHACGPDDWNILCAIEVDFHPSHIYERTKDNYRDSLVSYPVIRLRKDEIDLKNWFPKLMCLW